MKHEDLCGFDRRIPQPVGVAVVSKEGQQVTWKLANGHPKLVNVHWKLKLAHVVLVEELPQHKVVSENTLSACCRLFEPMCAESKTPTSSEREHCYHLPQESGQGGTDHTAVSLSHKTLVT